MNDYVHPTDDQVLNVLSNVEGIISQYVKHYPGKERTDVNPKWVENWFVERAKHYLESSGLDEFSSIDLDELLADVVNRQVSIVKQPATLLSIWPHYFRGFRNLPSPINLSGGLIVIEGRNSSGKTSLAEAFEWLLSGQLVRRSFSEMGDSKELESCISYQLKPEEEQIWVEAEFLATDGESFKVKRLLTQDYSGEDLSRAESEFYLNDQLLSRTEEETFLDGLLAGIPPVLMQHSLRTFVLSTPRQRRDYFERLLRLDEIANLIEKTVIGDARLPEFPSSLGSVAWKTWEDLKIRVPQEFRRSLKRVEQSARESIVPQTESALTLIARTQFGITDTSLSFDEIKREIESTQQHKREISFPLLENLRPKKTIDPQLLALFSEDYTKQDVSDLKKLHQVLTITKKAAENIGSAQMVIAQTLEDLSKSGVLVEISENQKCPLCEYEVPTLTPQRVKEIRSWQPAQQAVRDAEEKYFARIGVLRNKIGELLTARIGLIPDTPIDKEWANAVNDASDVIKAVALEFKKVLEDCIANVKTFDETQHDLISTLTSVVSIIPDIAQITTQSANLSGSLSIVIDKAHEYLDAFSTLENAVGKQAREDPEYNLREVWLSLAGNIDSLTTDFLWEQAKKKAQDELEKVRQFLLAARDRIIESRRTAFNDGMTAIWVKLRSDRYSAFSRLFIPPARGRGLPLEIEVKAILDDGTQQKEVDALKVFSESQINILGIAAFATRSRMLGHRLIILDDPVQSMDEDHFKTFSKDLLPILLDAGGQVVVLTHNDMFAREISYAWVDSNDYVTLEIRHSRRKGCCVFEGNRRVAERLKNAEKASEDGDLKSAWITVRLAIERLYTVTYIKHGPIDFNPITWIGLSAESMWNEGVGTIIESKKTGIGKRLKEILDMSASGGHDKPPKGFTDLSNAVSDLRKLLDILCLGNG